MDLPRPSKACKADASHKTDAAEMNVGNHPRNQSGQDRMARGVPAGRKDARHERDRADRLPHVKLHAALLRHSETLLAELLRFSAPADQVVSRYFRAHRTLGQRDRAFIAETTFAVLRRRRSLEAAAGSAQPRGLILAALVRLQGLSLRALGEQLSPQDRAIVERARRLQTDGLDAAVRAVEDRLIQPTLAEADEKSFRGPLQLYLKLLWLQAEVGAGGADVSGGADFAPTRAEQEVYELLAARLATVRSDFDTLYATTIPAFNQEMGAKGLGQLVTVSEPDDRKPSPAAVAVEIWGDWSD